MFLFLFSSLLSTKIVFLLLFCVILLEIWPNWRRFHFPMYKRTHLRLIKLYNRKTYWDTEKAEKERARTNKMAIICWKLITLFFIFRSFVFCNFWHKSFRIKLVFCFGLRIFFFRDFIMCAQLFLLLSVSVSVLVCAFFFSFRLLHAISFSKPITKPK